MTVYSTHYPFERCLNDENTNDTRAGQDPGPRAGNIEIYGHFEKGAWISVRLCDLTWSVPDELLSED